MEDIIRLEDVSYSYYDKYPAVTDITLSIKEGVKYGFIGANGSGKSTILQIMDGLLKQTEGKYYFKGHEVSELTLRDREFLKFFRGQVGYLFQDSEIQLFCPTVLDELLYGPLQLDISEEEAHARAHDVMKMLEIEKLKDRPSYMLSGGQKKKVAIGSILTMNPDVLLLDEPTNGLDPRTQCFLVELILSLNEAGKTIILATHDLSLIDELQTEVAVLSEDHSIVKTGKTADILGDEKLLLDVNLIHEHEHLHGHDTHKHVHSHFVFHRH